MLSGNAEFIASFAAPVRTPSIVIYLKEKGTNATVEVIGENDITELTYERVGDNTKFFGYGICQKMNVHIIDKNRDLDISTNNYFQVLLGCNNMVAYFSPKMYVSQVRRDELTNELSVTAYDAIYQMSGKTVSEVDITQGMTIGMYISEAAAVFGLETTYKGKYAPFGTTYIGKANFDGAETIREMLDSAAEATQSIYYIDSNDMLVFRQLDRDGEPVYTIDRAQYYDMDSSNNRRLCSLCHTTELGDAITAKMTQTGTTQYLRDNPFYELREDVHTLLENALDLIGGITINQFECDWRGNPLIELGEKIALVTKNGETVISYLLDDIIKFDGSMRQQTRWRYEDDPAETADNPSNLGEMLYKTYARVDKVNKEIEIVASNVSANGDEIAELRLNTNSIQASVTKTENAVNSALGNMNNDIADLTKKVEATITADDIKLEIQSQLQDGVGKVTTKTGFTFDDEGLTVSKSGSEMTTQITEDGMTVYRGGQSVLVADNQGVTATNLHADTYLWIGKYSRFEDYEPTRTGCFWVGG